MSSMSRRAVVGGIAAASTASLAEAHAPAGNEPRRYLRHQVFFWLKNPGSTEDRDKLVAGLRKLRAITEIKELHIGVPADTEPRPVVDNSFAVSELMLFENKQAQLAYQLHPLHKAFVAECEPLWSKVIVYDSMDL